MNKEDIKKMLPHREPMLLLDQVWMEGEESVGTYSVQGDEWFLQGHFPGNPVVPGVVLCEMMGQSACLLVAQEGGYTPYFTGMDQVRFKNKVLPGDLVELRCGLIKSKGPFYFVKASASVKGTLCASGELSFVLVKDVG